MLALFPPSLSRPSPSRITAQTHSLSTTMMPNDPLFECLAPAAFEPSFLSRVPRTKRAPSSTSDGRKKKPAKKAVDASYLGIYEYLMGPEACACCRGALGKVAPSMLFCQLYQHHCPSEPHEPVQHTQPPPPPPNTAGIPALPDLTMTVTMSLMETKPLRKKQLRGPRLAGRAPAERVSGRRRRTPRPVLRH